MPFWTWSWYDVSRRLGSKPVVLVRDDGRNGMPGQHRSWGIRFFIKMIVLVAGFVILSKV